MTQKLTFDYQRIFFPLFYACLDYFSKHVEERSLLRWLLIYFYQLICSLSNRWEYATVKNVLVLAGTLNNQRTFNPVLEKLYTKDYSYYKNVNELLPYTPILWYSLLWLPAFIKLYWTSTENEKKLIRKKGIDLLTIPGVYKVVEKIYEKNPNIKLVMFANDHDPIYRCFIDQANNCGIKTLYVQHASISAQFPPLTFSYSFLDGQETLDKYRQCGQIFSNVVLSGSSRFDMAMNWERQANNNVGVAFNILDSEKKVYETCKYLKKIGYNNIIARPHPRQTNIDNLISQLEKEGVKISMPETENPFMFLSRISFLIAGDSSIHLDSALLGIPSVMYNWTAGEVMDSYKYRDLRMVPYAESNEALSAAIKQKKLPPISLIQYFIASFGTPFHGRTSELIAGFVDALVDGQQDEYLQSHFDINTEGVYVLKGMA